MRDGEALPVRAAGQLTLPAVLLPHRGELACRAELVDAPWGEAPPRGADGPVATHAARLRRVPEPERIRRTAPRVLVSGRDLVRPCGSDGTTWTCGGSGDALVLADFRTIDAMSALVDRVAAQAAQAARVRTSRCDGDGSARGLRRTAVPVP
ncbi:hypothetical protein ABZZ79_35325 [Streptomyces sp. NPDC006458]|uniref:hypothetical protein n=1 Tax=Streptomyces sp. NPDC006458 TaxID=3154302 RepID=UPI0033B4719A